MCNCTCINIELWWLSRHSSLDNFYRILLYASEIFNAFDWIWSRVCGTQNLIGLARVTRNAISNLLSSIWPIFSWKLKWALLITCRPLSVCLSVRLKTFHILIFFSRTTEPISTKLGTKHPWVMGIQFSNEGRSSFPRGDNYKLAKIHWQN